LDKQHGKNTTKVFFNRIILFLLINILYKYSKDTFKWIDECYIIGNAIEIRKGINSLTRCGKACFRSKDCNGFTFSASTCSLMTVNEINQQFSVAKNSICGLILNRIPKSFSKCQLQTSDDGSYQWMENCHIAYYSTIPGTTSMIGSSSTSNSTRSCAEACLANPDCNYFHFRNQSNSYDCFLDQHYGLPYDEIYPGINSGFIVSRKYNVEFIPNYCVNYYSVN
jgi:hypothetical protein